MARLQVLVLGRVPEQALMKQRTWVRSPLNRPTLSQPAAVFAWLACLLLPTLLGPLQRSADFA